MYWVLLSKRENIYIYIYTGIVFSALFPDSEAGFFDSDFSASVPSSSALSSCSSSSHMALTTSWGIVFFEHLASVFGLFGHLCSSFTMLSFVARIIWSEGGCWRL